MSLREAENFCGKLRPGETSYFQGQLSLRTFKRFTSKSSIPEECEEPSKILKKKAKRVKKLTKATTRKLEDLSRSLETCLTFVNNHFPDSK